MSSTELDTHHRILAETLRLMEEQRGRGVRISDIAQAAGVSRQAVYLHFANRTELLVATARYADEIHGLNERLQPVLSAPNSLASLRAFIEFWENYIPVIHGLASALIEARSTDEAAAAAWSDRMQAVRGGCQTIIDCFRRDHILRPELDPDQAVDLLWSLLGIGVWENLTIDCGWTTEQVIRRLQDLAEKGLVRDEKGIPNA